MHKSNTLQCGLRLEWEDVGLANLDSGNKICFPKLPARPGLYRFHAIGTSGARAAYLGETDNLQRRFAHYRNPGPTQLTNLRLNAFFKEILIGGGSIAIATITDRAWIKWDTEERLADLSRKSIRRLFEGLVLSVENATEVENLNR